MNPIAIRLTESVPQARPRPRSLRGPRNPLAALPSHRLAAPVPSPAAPVEPARVSAVERASGGPAGFTRRERPGAARALPSLPSLPSLPPPRAAELPGRGRAAPRSLPRTARVSHRPTPLGWSIASHQTVVPAALAGTPAARPDSATFGPRTRRAPDSTSLSVAASRPSEAFGLTARGSRRAGRPELPLPEPSPAGDELERAGQRIGHDIGATVGAMLEEVIPVAVQRAVATSQRRLLASF